MIDIFGQVLHSMLNTTLGIQVMEFVTLGVVKKPINVYSLPFC